MAACVPVLDISVGYKRKLSSVYQDTPRCSNNKVQRVTNAEDQQELLIDPTSLSTHAASYPELNDIQFLEDHNQLHLADSFLMDSSSFEETSPNQDISATPLPSPDEDNIINMINASATDHVQPQCLTDSTADNNVISFDEEEDDDNDEEVCIVINLEDDDADEYNVINVSATDPVQPQSLTDSTADNNNVIKFDEDSDDDNDDKECIVINLDDDDDDETNSVLQQSFTSVQTIQSTKEVADISNKGNNDVQPSPTMTDSSFLDSSIDCQMQHADNAQGRLYEDSHDTHDSRTVNFKDFCEGEFNHAQGISEDLDFTKLIDFEKLDLDFYENELDLIRLGCDALESPRTDSLADASFPSLKQPTFEVREIKGIEVVIID